MSILNKFAIGLCLLGISSSLWSAVSLEFDASSIGSVNTIAIQQPEDSTADWRFYEPNGGLIRGRFELWVPFEYDVSILSQDTDWTFHQHEVESNGSTYNLTTWYFEGLSESSTNEFDVFLYVESAWEANFTVSDDSDTVSVITSEVHIYATIVNNLNPFMTPITAIQYETLDVVAVPEANFGGCSILITAAIVMFRRRRFRDL